jgi:hypothetical protein
MTGTNCDLFTHKQSRSYLNHLVLTANAKPKFSDPDLKQTATLLKLYTLSFFFLYYLLHSVLFHTTVTRRTSGRSLVIC